MLPAFVIALSYLLGSIPFGYLIVRFASGGDVRETGSGGTGATNVTRRAGKSAGLLTLALDAVKGIVATVIARSLLTPDFGINWYVALAAIAVIAGHIFPVWLGFRGGKGVATGLGVFLILAPLATICAMLAFLLVFALTKYVSLGSIIAAATMPLFVWLPQLLAPRSPQTLAPLLLASALGGALIIFMHRANIGRLLRGTENRFGRGRRSEKGR